MIGKITRVPLREVWKHEAHQFTKWIEENIDILNEVLGSAFSNVKREQAAGDFNVDLIAEDEAGNTVIIENQLEKSNHDHLGKVITYLVAIEAKTAIWIVADPRPEHMAAINWLNQTGSASFYLLKVEGIRIGDSPPAPLLTLIVGPSQEGRDVGVKKKELAERHLIRHHFWETLLERAKAMTKLHTNLSPSHSNWIATGAGKGGLVFSYVVRENGTNVELYIDRGKNMEAENKAIFDTLFRSKREIEEAFGDDLEWQRLDGKQASRIRKSFNMGGWRNEEDWPKIQVATIDAMIKLEKVLRPYIDKL